jgi:hypothetical protein
MKKLSLSVLILAFFAYSPSLFAQGPTGRFRQSIIINGQAANGVYLMENGVVQSPSCANPQPYQTVDGSSAGYACFDAPSGTWLLSAQPAYTQPSTAYYYPQPTYSYEYSPYYYPYYGGGYYSGGFGYPYYWGPGLGLGLGFAFGSGFHNRGFVVHNNRAFVNRGFGHNRVFVGRPAFNGGFRGGSFHGGAFRGGGFHGGGFRGGGFRGGGFHGGGGGFRGGGFHGGGGGFRGGGGGFRGGGRR